MLTTYVSYSGCVYFCVLILLCEVLDKRKKSRSYATGHQGADPDFPLCQISVLYAKKPTAPPAGLSFIKHPPASTKDLSIKPH